MNTYNNIYKTANLRRIQYQLQYAGALTPGEAFELLALEPLGLLIDVRTHAELDWVGYPVVANNQYVHVEWTQYPGAIQNSKFVEQLYKVAMPHTLILLLCRSAIRSKLAAEAAANAGFVRAFDILEGFEGKKDDRGHRKTISGWCFRGLPWVSA
ncbi:rhodanese-like domain-containing protein [Candidatus Vallotia cooleyia]|uniref:rhodanese-like domain-containing protein n=1 Tax=Candidatus Vallotiella adelgis TaxID=1177211 RepID=UPI001D00ABD2|nr:rhodanese-like domain-containing protein [Candidatus Vallotia cooleyia]UDG82337.1 hypothetical protein GJV44_00601 [Candidatus Vallotia cooleyia]